MDSILFWLVPVASVLALCFAYYFHKQMMKESEGTPQMIKIAAAVRKGAMSYLKQQYKIVGCVFLGLVILFSIMVWLSCSECVGSHSFPDGWFLLRSFRFPGYEDGNLCFGTYGECGTQFIELRTENRFPQWCGNGTRCSRTGVARYIFLVSVAERGDSRRRTDTDS